MKVPPVFNSIDEVVAHDKWSELPEGTVICDRVIVQRLGNGTNGTAYLTDKNTVLKITLNGMEISSMQRLLQGQLPPDVMAIHCTVHRVMTTQKGYGMYGLIEKEYVPYLIQGYPHENWKKWTEQQDAVDKANNGILRDFTHSPNVGIREDGTFVCFDGMFR